MHPKYKDSLLSFCRIFLKSRPTGTLLVFLVVGMFAVGDPSLGQVLRYDMDNLYYTHLFLGVTKLQNRMPKEVALSLVNSGAFLAQERTLCRIEGLRQYADGNSTFPVLLEPDSGQCTPVTVLGAEPVILPIFQLVPSRPIYRRGESELEFRYNSSIWGALFVEKSHVYQFQIEARCLGPVPAQVQVNVNEIIKVFEFFDVPSSESFQVELPSGVTWFRLSYINDKSINGKDRNLRVISVKVLPHVN